MWKKVLLIVLGLLVLAVAGFVGIVSMQPAEFRVERSQTIAAPPAEVFPHVNNLHKWEAWSPWAKLDPNAKSTFDGPEEGDGAIFTWAGNDQIGEGKMTIVESRPDELVRIKLEFLKPFAATNTSEFVFEPDSDGTKVVWSMYGPNNFLSKAMHLFMDMDALVGGDFEKGLLAMKTEVEGEAPPETPADAPPESSTPQ